MPIDIKCEKTVYVKYILFHLITIYFLITPQLLNNFLYSLSVMTILTPSFFC